MHRVRLMPPAWAPQARHPVVLIALLHIHRGCVGRCILCRMRVGHPVVVGHRAHPQLPPVKVALHDKGRAGLRRPSCSPPGASGLHSRTSRCDDGDWPALLLWKHKEARHHLLMRGPWMGGLLLVGVGGRGYWVILAVFLCLVVLQAHVGKLVAELNCV